MNEPSDDEEENENSSPESGQWSSEHGPTPFIFNNHAGIQGLREFHPPSPQMALLFDMYFHHCDTILKVLHKPTMAQLFTRAGNNISDIGSAGNECLMFAMYYASVTGIAEDECLRYFQEKKEKLVTRYKYATEIALTNADFLNSMELAPLQALSIYLVSNLSTLIAIHEYQGYQFSL